MNRHRLLPEAPVILVLALAFAVSIHMEGQTKSRMKEPPIPVIIGSGQNRIQAPNAQSIVLSVSDFNYLMQREDSLRKAIAEQTHQLRYEARSRSFLVYALIIGLFLSNIASIAIVTRQSKGVRG